MFHVDSHFEIGSSHQVCQDFAVHGEWENSEFGRVIWGIVSDGCSGSKHTDTGARVLVHMMDAVIRQYLDLYPEFFTHSAEQLQSHLYTGLMGACPNKTSNMVHVARSLGLDMSALDATLWVLVAVTVNGKTTFKVVGWGDGEIVARLNGENSIRCVDYPSGAPYYLSYHLDDQRNVAYFNQFGGYREYERFVPSQPDLRFRKLEDCRNLLVFEQEDTPEVKVDSVSVFTDGVKTYTENVEEKHGSLIWGTQRLIDFQSVEGVFLQRRMRALSRRDIKDGIRHSDDIGGVSIVRTEEPQ